MEWYHHILQYLNQSPEKAKCCPSPQDILTSEMQTALSPPADMSRMGVCCIPGIAISTKVPASTWSPPPFEPTTCMTLLNPTTTGTLPPVKELSISTFLPKVVLNDEKNTVLIKHDRSWKYQDNSFCLPRSPSAPPSFKPQRIRITLS